MGECKRTCSVPVDSNEENRAVPQNPKWLFHIFLLFFFFFFSPSLSQPQTNVAGLLCGSSNQDTVPDFLPNFIVAMEKVSKEVNESRWAAQSVTSPAPEIFTYAQCYDFLSHDDCVACHSESRTELPRCLPANSARIYLDGCYLRYDNYSFFEEAVDKYRDMVKCGNPGGVTRDQYIGREFANRVRQVVHNVAKTAVRGVGFAAVSQKGGVEAVYAVAQCWTTLNPDGCKKCLSSAVQKVISCAPAPEGRAMNAGCYLRYSAENFYGNGNENGVLYTKSESRAFVIIIVGILSVIALFFLALIGAFLGYTRISDRKRERKNLADISISVHKSDLNYKYEMLEKATDSFDSSRKLGQGGAGSVFKGTFPDGTIVAVKRLFFNTRQWVDEFFNEVNLIRGIQHKNLVRLLGCSIEGPESLLVYEYLPNKSLDQILFGKSNTFLLLTWQKRFDIIFGVADGLAYLHGSCGEKIIHRDIKTSNILLDENLTPKIADFGLARCVAPNKSHISTGVAGTLGYMAPEYLVRGQLTEKADVYAFGVLVLEIVSGRKNSVFSQGSSVLLSVWRNYKAKKITESVDPALEGIYSVREASNVLRIGLLCTQASAALRPSMFEVVEMLSDEACVIPSPKQPPFLNASVLSLDDTTTAYPTIVQTGKQTTERFTSSNNKPSNGKSAAEVSTLYSAESASMDIPGSNSLSRFQASEPS